MLLANAVLHANGQRVRSQPLTSGKLLEANQRTPR